jgi:hypothetical protein
MFKEPLILTLMFSNNRLTGNECNPHWLLIPTTPLAAVSYAVPPFSYVTWIWHEITGAESKRFAVDIGMLKAMLLPAAYALLLFVGS